MVALNRTSLFWPGQPVRLLVGFLAWSARDSNSSHFRPDERECRWLLSSEPITFLRFHPDKPGCCVVRDACGLRWYAPTDYLAADARASTEAFA